MEIIEKAPAKINLGLNALYKRNDRYHELEMIMASIDLSDRLSFSEISENRILLSSNNSLLPLDRRNHVYQAACLLRRRFGITRGVKIHIDKKIPISAGLAGGSSDCAATLRGLNRLWGLNLRLEELAKIGEQIGSDVPYCIYGNTAFVSGRGEVIEPLPFLPNCYCLLVKPPMSVSTRAIFKGLNVERVSHPDCRKMKQAIIENDYAQLISLMGNSLEDVTIRRYPKIQRIKNCMKLQGVDVALMSGSGPTVFALIKQEKKAKQVFNALKGFNKEVYLVRLLNSAHKEEIS